MCLEGLALAKKYDFTEDRIFMLRHLRDYYVRKGDLRNAIKVDTEADKLDEILKKEKKTETLNQVELNYIQNKNKEEIQKITKEKDREVNQRDVINILLILLVIIIVVTSIVTYYLLKLKYKHSKQIRELMQSKANLYGNLVKDFRSPLTIIMGYSEYIKHKSKDIDPDELIRMLEIVENKTLELINLANQMLTVDKVKGDSHCNQWIEGNISLFVQMITENFSDLAEDENNKLSFNTIDWDMEVSFVPYLLDQILNHLFIYAIARSDKDATIDISINKEPKERYSIAISTKSSEMNAEKLLTTFEAKGISSDSKETDMGFRIDLSYVRQLINIINGKIEIVQNGNITTFKIILPRKYSSNPIETKVKGLNKTDIANAAMKVVNTIIESNKKKSDIIEEQEIDEHQIDLDEEDTRDLILVVEDNKEIAKYIRRILSDQYQVIIAHSGEEAIEKTNEYYPDLIVLNRVLKGMSGTETCKIIKGDKKTSYIPVIMLTSTGKFDEQNQSLRGGADAYLMKPFLEEDLINSIGNILKLCHGLRNSIEKSYTLKTKENVIAAGEKEFGNNKDSEEEPNKEDLTNQIEEEKNTFEESEKITNPDKLEGYDKEFFENLSKCISDNISDPDFDRNEMASALNISLSQLSRKVKSLTGQSPSAYIRKIRISCAEELLRGTTKTITDVAYELGFRDYQSFLRAFKSEMGYLPSQSQKQGHDNQIDIQ
ncbi:response regulator [Falsiporphyromonas endometrii]|uniref:histidine kinase n=1 Tax=Falsiporphyromonas endometrii TaxID=1387297 RepID=A0ABV9K4X5_9PORP